MSTVSNTMSNYAESMAVYQNASSKKTTEEEKKGDTVETEKSDGENKVKVSG